MIYFGLLSVLPGIIPDHFLQFIKKANPEGFAFNWLLNRNFYLEE